MSVFLALVWRYTQRKHSLQNELMNETYRGRNSKWCSSSSKWRCTLWFSVQSADHSSSKSLDCLDPAHKILFPLKMHLSHSSMCPAQARKGGTACMSVHARWTHEQPSVTYLEWGSGGYMFHIVRDLQVSIRSCAKKYWYWTKPINWGHKNIYWSRQWQPCLSRNSDQLLYNYCMFRFEWIRS